MSQLYARVFVRILQSSLADDWHTRHVFEDCLKLASAEGIVDVTRSAFCRITNAPPEIVDRAFTKLEAPDPSSRDAAEEGRRLVRLDEHRDWGWRIVNWEKYQAIRCRADEREVERVQKQRQRERRRTELPPAPPSRPEVDSDSDIDTEGPGVVPDVSRTSPGRIATGEAVQLQGDLVSEGPSITAESIYQAYPKHVARGAALKAIRSAMKKVKPAELLAAVVKFAAHHVAVGTEKRFIPHPATWFNGEQWADEESPQPSRPTGHAKFIPPSPPGTKPTATVSKTF